MIEIIQGDLTEMEVDAIVNAANTDLYLGAGVAGLIRKKGGPTIQEECDLHGHVKLGEAAITKAGDLKAKYVIHAASMVLGGTTSFESLLNATKNSLALAEAYKLESMAFPAIGTGIARFPVDSCARIMFGAVETHLEGNTSLKKVVFVLWEPAIFETFKEVFQKG